MAGLVLAVGKEILLEQALVWEFGFFCIPQRGVG